MKPATIKSILMLLLAVMMRATLTSNLLFETPKHDGHYAQMLLHALSAAAAQFSLTVRLNSQSPCYVQGQTLFAQALTTQLDVVAT